mgnify:CR=1 FL=1
METIKKYEVKVVAEYIAYIELEPGEDITDEELEERAWREFYDEAHKASIEEVTIEHRQQDCEECGEEDVEDDHECEEEEDEDNSDNSEEEDN